MVKVCKNVRLNYAENFMYGLLMSSVEDLVTAVIKIRIRKWKLRCSIKHLMETGMETIGQNGHCDEERTCVELSRNQFPGVFRYLV